MPNTYDVGDSVRCAGAWTDADSAAFDPDTVVFKHKDPSDNETTLTHGVDAEVVKDSTGNYHVDVDVDESGTWWYRFEGTASGGGKRGAGEDYFDVLSSAFS
jgi:hypothetical protein